MKKQICGLLACIMVILSLAGCNGLSKKEPVDGDLVSADGLISLKNGPVFSGEAVNASVSGDILKLDDITPGLNTYTMKTTLYSLKEQKILGQTASLPEADWNTGSLNEGFYAAALDRCEVILFDNNCKEVLRKKPADAGNLWAFAAVSPDRKYMVYGDAQSAEIYVYTFADDSIKRVGIFNGYIEVAGFFDGTCFLRTGDRVLIKVDPLKERSEVAFVDIRLNLLTPYYSLGKTDVNFMVKTPDQAPLQYTEFSSVDEIPVAADEWGFVTVASEIENDLVRVYRVHDAVTFAFKVPDRIQQVYCADEQLVIVAKDRQSGEVKLYLQNASSAETSPIVFTDTDQIPPLNNQAGRPGPVPEAPSKSEPQTAETTESAGNVPEAPSKNSMRIKGVPVIAQMPDYPTGCESVSAVMALQFAGEKITVDTFIDQYLEKSSDFYSSGGVRYGPNPYEVFIGNPRSRSAFGCMAPVIEKALVKYFASETRVVNATGKSMEALCRDYIDQGIPVMVWTSIKMIEPYYTSQWTLSNGEEYRWLANEHCMLLTGYDQDNYYYNDPYTGKEVRYGKSLSEKRYEAFGRQSVVIIK